jgi:hypothetical protein
MWHVLGRREMRTEFWWGNPKDRDHMENLGIYERMIIKWI